MSAQNIWTIVVVLLIVVWILQLLWLAMSASNQGRDFIHVVSGATIFFPVPLPVAQAAPGAVDRVAGFWKSIHDSIFGSSGRGAGTPTLAPAGPVNAAAAQARLLIDGQEFPLSHPRTRMGRYPNNEVVIDHATVSAYHAEIIRRPDNRHEIVDRESRNGTRVNGALIRSQILKDGDLITLGGATLHYLSSPPPAQQTSYRPDVDDDPYEFSASQTPSGPPSGPGLR